MRRSGKHTSLATFLVLAFSTSILNAQATKPYVLKRTRAVIVDGKESYRVPMVRGVTSSGIKFELLMIDSQIERRLIFPDGTLVNVRDALKIKTTIPWHTPPPDPDCNWKVLDSTTIHGVKASLMEREGMKGWVAPTLGCAMLRGLNTMPSGATTPVTQNKIDTDSIEFTDPPKELFSVDNLEELPPSEYRLRVEKSKNRPDAIIARMRETMKKNGVDDMYYRARQAKK